MNERLDRRDSPAVSWFWIVGGLIVLLCGILATQRIDRPIGGLHSRGEAAHAWRARVHVRHGLDDTRGIARWTVGYPPGESWNNLSLDHPQLGLAAMSLDMLVFGVNDWSMRLGRAIRQMIAVAIFLLIGRRLVGDRAALLGGLILAIFPLTAYFALPKWTVVFAFAAIYFYLSRIGAFHDDRPAPRWHLWALAAALFVSVQMAWDGFFYAAGIGIHYVGTAVRRRRLDGRLLTVLIAAPLVSLAGALAILLAARGWDVGGLYEVFLRRAGSGEEEAFGWGAWMEKLWHSAVTNFTLPVLIVAMVFVALLAAKKLGELLTRISGRDVRLEAPIREFPCFWLFLLPGILQLLILRGGLWRHQWWERPLGPLVAIAAALGVLQAHDWLARVRAKLATAATVVLVGLIAFFCGRGINYYYAIQEMPDEFVDMWRTLNANTPPDKKLLSYLPFRVEQHAAKGSPYSPQMAWYLDREVDVARTFEEIQARAATGEYPYYVVPATADMRPLIEKLRRRYALLRPVSYLRPVRNVDPFLIFDLQMPPMRRDQRGPAGSYP